MVIGRGIHRSCPGPSPGSSQTEQIAGRDPLAFLDGDTVPAEVSELDVAAVADVDHHDVAGGVVGVGFTDRKFTMAIFGGDDGPVGGGQDRFCPAVVRLRVVSIAGMGLPIALDDEIDGVPLIGEQGPVRLTSKLLPLEGTNHSPAKGAAMAMASSVPERS